MMMILISDKTLRVAVGCVKSKSINTFIKTTLDLIIIEQYLISDIATIKHILPTLVSKHERFPYLDGKTLQLAFNNAVKSTISGNYDLKSFLNYLRRVYIASGLAESDEDFRIKIKEMWQLARYIEANKNEI
jgi:hypothetical protein